MSINNLPASIQNAIQLGFLEREFHEPLRATMAYRSVAEKIVFPGNIGETLTRTRGALFPAVTTPSSTSANSDLDNGMSSQYWGDEQYVMSLQQYKFTTDLNMVGSAVAIASVFLQNAKKLAEGAARSVETLAQQALYNTFLGQNTRVLTTLGAPGLTVAVDDIRGFGSSWTSANTPIAVSTSNPLAVTFYRSAAYSLATQAANVTGGTYNCTGVTADVSNISTSPGGISGTLTFATGTNVTVADATLGNGVLAAVAPIIQRPYGRQTTLQLGIGDTINAQMILNAKSTMVANGVAPFAGGNYRFIADPYMMNPLYNDPAFQRFQIGHTSSDVYLKGTVGTIMGVDIVESTMTPIQNSLGGGKVHRGLLLGDGVMIESDYTGTGYDEVRNSMDGELITVAEGIAHITRPPLDRLGQVIAQSWTFIGGFCAPTDLTTTTSTVPTSNNSAWKRGIVIEATVA